jgi:ABC-2 type transport system permease protein
MSSPAVVWAHRNLISNLARRDLKAKYKKSLLGWLWSLINPAATLAVYTFVFGVILKGQAPVAGNGTLQAFPLYLFAGLVVWNLFQNSLNSAMGALEGSGGLLTKIYFPPECPAIASVMGVLLQAAIEAGILIVVLIGFGNVSWTMLFVPLVLFEVLLLATGIGMVLSLLNINYRDVGYITSIALQVVFYCTPIVYSIDLVPETVWGLPARRLIELNPIAQFVEALRELVWALQLPSWQNVLYITVVSVGVFLGGWWYFSTHADRVIEEL